MTTTATPEVTDAELRAEYDQYVARLHATVPAHLRTEAPAAAAPTAPTRAAFRPYSSAELAAMEARVASRKEAPATAAPTAARSAAATFSASEETLVAGVVAQARALMNDPEVNRDAVLDLLCDTSTACGAAGDATMARVYEQALKELGG